MLFDVIKKASWDLDIAQSKLAELKKLEMINDENIAAILLAADNYADSLAVLLARLEALRGFKSTLDIEKFLAKTADQLFFHEQIFDELHEKFSQNADFQASASNVRELIGRSISVLFTVSADDKGLADAILKSALNYLESLRELGAAEIIERWGEYLGDTERRQLAISKETLLIRFSGWLEYQSLVGGVLVLPGFDVSSSDFLRRLRLLDEVRELIANSDLKSQINVLRQHFIDQLRANGRIGEEESTVAIAIAEKYLAELEKVLAEIKPIPSSVKQLWDRAKFQIEQANELLAKENYGNAFGQAIASAAAARTAIAQLFSPDASVEIKILAADYDRLFQIAADSGFNKENQPELSALFREAEKKIGEVAQLITNGSGKDKLIIPVHQIKLLLVTIEFFLEGEASSE